MLEAAALPALAVLVGIFVHSIIRLSSRISGPGTMSKPTLSKAALRAPPAKGHFFRLDTQMEEEEMHFVVDKDTETGEHASARERFQIACLSIEDPDRNSVDITKLVDQGKRFLSNDELKEYISGRFNIPVANVDLIAE